MTKCLILWRPQRDLNPCYRRERPISGQAFRRMFAVFNHQSLSVDQWLTGCWQTLLGGIWLRDSTLDRVVAFSTRQR